MPNFRPRPSDRPFAFMLVVLLIISIGVTIKVKTQQKYEQEMNIPETQRDSYLSKILIVSWVLFICLFLLYIYIYYTDKQSLLFRHV